MPTQYTRVKHNTHVQTYTIQNALAHNTQGFILNSYGLNTILIINNFMEQFKHLNLTTLKQIKHTILHTPFHIGWVFAVLITGMVVCIYALSQLV